MPDAGLGPAREVRTLLWLQGRLLRRAFLSTRSRDMNRTLSLVILVIALSPQLLISSGLLAWFLHTSPSVTGAQLLAVVFTYLMLMWLFAPASGQQVFEPLNLPKLFIHPISFRGLALGSLAIGFISVATLASLPVFFAIWAGASRGGLSALGVGISLAAFLLLLVVLKAIMTDVLDLMVEDRRWRNAFTALAVAPWLSLSLLPTLITSRMGGEPTWQGFLALQPLKWLGPLPSGWAAHAILAAVEGRPGVWLVGTGLILGLAALGAGVHDRLLRRLYAGDLARAQRPQVEGDGRIEADAGAIPGLSGLDSRRLRALMRKDWLNLRRNPLLPRLAFLPFMLGFLVFFLTRNIARDTAGVSDHPLILGLAVGTLIAFLSTVTAPNALAFLDHRGLGTLLQMPVPRHLILLSQSLVQMGWSALIAVVMAGIAGLSSGRVSVFAATLLVAGLSLCVFMGVASVSSVAAPYYVDLERGRASSTGAAPFVGCAMFGVMLILAAPIYLALGLTAFLYTARLPLAIAGVSVYAVVVYLGLLAFASRLFPRREEKMLVEVVEGR